MLYKPTELSPSGLAVDASESITFRWRPNGDIMTAFEVEIQDNNTMAVVHMSGLVLSSSPVYTVSPNTLQNGVQHRWRVRVYNAVNQSIESDWQVLDCYSKPVVSINTDGVVRNQNALFIGTYSQLEGIAIRSYRYRLYNSLGSLVGDSGQVHDGTLQHVFSGLDANAEYEVVLEATSQVGLTGSSGRIKFRTEFDTPSPTRSVHVEVVEGYPVFEISWPNPKQILGRYNGPKDEPDYVEGKWGQAISLGPNESVTFTEPIPEEYTITNFFRPPVGFSGAIVRLENGTGDYVTFGYDATRQCFFLRTYSGPVHSQIASPVVELEDDFMFYALQHGRAFYRIGDGELVSFGGVS